MINDKNTEVEAMSTQNTNDSYNRCLAELRARYSTRGISVNVRNGAQEQIKKEQSNKTLASGNYYIFDSRSGIASQYRSGEYNGSKYMTSDDFVRYFKSRRPYSMPGVAKAADQTEVKVAQTVSRTVPASRSGEGNKSSSDAKEGHLKTAVSALIAFKNKWLPIERKEGRTIGERFRFPAAAMSGMAVFALSLGLIVGGSVMLGRASGQLGSVNTQIAVLEAEQSELQGKLDLKYDIESIKADAEALGMISGKYAGGEYLELSQDEKVEIYEEEQEENIFSTLLNAFGIKIK